MQLLLGNNIEKNFIVLFIKSCYPTMQLLLGNNIEKNL